MRLHKISKSIRVPADLHAGLKKPIIRLSLNPVLYARSRNLVRWSRASVGTLPPIAVVQQAMRRYPDLALSSAVEVVLTDLLVDSAPRLTAQEEAQFRRFSRLSLMEQIRLTQRRIRTARYLQSLH